MLSIRKKREYTSIILFIVIILLTFFVLNKLLSVQIIGNKFSSYGLSTDTLSLVKSYTRCQERSRLTTIEIRGNYTVFYNLMLANRKFACHESVTYATQGDFMFLDNIPVLLARWQGPISVALNAPGSDFLATLHSIAYLRKCADQQIKDYVTFHLYYENKHGPKFVNGTHTFLKSYNWDWDCSVQPPYQTVKPKDRYRVKNKMNFPINIGRNIAIETATTYYFLSSDIELYPSINLISRFLEMIASDYKQIEQVPKKVFGVAVFESTGNLPSPMTKTELQNLYEQRQALFFCEIYCPECHGIPKKLDWIANNDTEQKYTIFANAKRSGKYKRWEPVYISTHQDPLFLERVTWDGGSDKMSKDFILCLQDYEILLLDQAFLVHRPGFKKIAVQNKKTKLEMTKVILEEIVPELESLYGTRKGCVIGGQFSINLPDYDKKK